MTKANEDLHDYEFQNLIQIARVPISTSFGRRPVMLLSTLMCLASNIWRAKAQTYSSFMGACVLNGIGAGPAEVRCRDTRNG